METPPMKAHLIVLAGLALAACSPTTPTTSPTASPTAGASVTPTASSAPVAATGGTFEVTVDTVPVDFTSPPTATLANADVFMYFRRGTEGKGSWAKITLEENSRFKTPVILPPATNGTARQCTVSNGINSFWASRQGSQTDEDKLVIEGGHLKGTWKYHSYAWSDMSPAGTTRHDVVVTIDMQLPAGLQ
jgi:hypothetical protein